MDRKAANLRRRRPRWTTLLLVVALHILAIVGLARAFAPDFTSAVVRDAVAVLTVNVTALPDEPAAPVADPEPDEGAAGEEGRLATPSEISAPPAALPIRPSPVPRAPSTGTDTQSGARDSGEGTGAGGTGEGTGSGTAGSGQGSGGASPAVKIAGDINSASDYPVPEGGRQARFGTSVTIAITVGTDGVPTGCRVHIPSPFPETDAITCRLAMERFRFRPATDRGGNPIVSVYGWRQEFRQSP